MEAIAFAVLIVAQPAAVIALQLYSQPHFLPAPYLSPVPSPGPGPALRTDVPRGDRSCLLTERSA